MNTPNWLGVPQDLPGALLATRDTLARIEELMRVLVEQGERSNVPAAPPDLVDLGPGLSLTTHVRYRTLGLIFTGGTSSDQFALKVGSRALITFFPGSSWIPFVQTIDRGVTIAVVDLTTPAATNWYAMLVAGVE